MKVRCVIPADARKQLGRGVALVVAVLIVGYAARLVIVQMRASEPVNVQANANSNAIPRTDPRPPAAPVALAAPGRIEGRSETIGVGASIDGVVRAIYVKEGQWVPQGDALAELDCADLKSGLQVSRAEAESFNQIRVRLLRGSRQEERDTAAQKTVAARAVLAQAAAQKDRMAKLYEAESVSRAANDEAVRDYEVAESMLRQAMRNEELVNAQPLEEEVARADADLLAARERIQQAEDRIGKCLVRAPISGTILRVRLRAGESFALVSPRPLFSMADLSSRRVRAEVDERDVRSVRIGQKIRISADAAPTPFQGTVTQISSTMGRKSVLTGDPVEKTDRDVLEVVAELENGARELPIGLRVTVRFEK